MWLEMSLIAPLVGWHFTEVDVPEPDALEHGWAKYSQLLLPFKYGSFQMIFLGRRILLLNQIWSSGRAKLVAVKVRKLAVTFL